MVLQLRFLVRCDEDDAIDGLLVGGAVAVVAVASPMLVVENEDSTMNSMGYEKISAAAKLTENDSFALEFNQMKNACIRSLPLM